MTQSQLCDNFASKYQKSPEMLTFFPPKHELMGHQLNKAVVVVLLKQFEFEVLIF